MEYLNHVQDKYFAELVDQPGFKEDLETFFTGGRYNHTKEELENRGAKGLANDFAEHMRFQSQNEVSALYDFNYVKNRDMPETGKLAFGRLMQAYDISEGGGDGTWSSTAEGAWDYARAIGSAPTTIASVATLGLGLGPKIMAQAGLKATQMSLRNTISNMLAKEMSKEAIKKELKKKYTTQGLKAAAGTFAVEAGVGAYQGAAVGETKERLAGPEGYIEGFEYTNADLVSDAAIAGTVGTTIGTLGSIFDTKSYNRTIDLVTDVQERGMKAKLEGRRAAIDKLTELGSDPDQVRQLADPIVELVNILRKRDLGTKAPLDADLVAEGDKILNDMMNPSVDKFLTPSLHIDTVRGITAAAADLKDVLEIRPNERISSAIMRALQPQGRNQPPLITTMDLDLMAKKYGLSPQQLSYTWLADLSKAGATLGEAGRLSQLMKNELGDLNLLARAGVSTIGEAEAEGIMSIARQGKHSKHAGGKEWWLTGAARTLDRSRIAFMTSQLGTTAANTITTGGFLAIDMSDQLWKNVFRSTVGVAAPDGTVKRGWIKGNLSTLKGLTFNRGEADAFAMLMSDELPETYKTLFLDSMRASDVAGGNSYIARASRMANFLNTTTDSLYKQGAMYGSVDRQLRENFFTTGEGFKDLASFLAEGKSLTELPQGLMAKAVDDAKRFTFQKDYRKDTSIFGKTASAIQRIHYKFPFVVSSLLDMPFPRYMANHLETMYDYLPVLPHITASGGVGKVFKKAGVIDDMFKTGADRHARGLTGTMLVMGGVAVAAQKEGKIDYDKMETETKSRADLRRVLGPWASSALIGDMIYRKVSGLPLGPDFFESIKEVIGDTGLVSDFGQLNVDLLKDIQESATKLEMTEGLAKQLGDITAVFSYPTTSARDLQGQINPEAAGNPFTEDALRGVGEPYKNKSFLEDIVHKNTYINQAIRFLPDYMGSMNVLDNNSNLNGELDLKIYDFFSPYPRGSYNPINRQFGIATEHPATGLQAEITQLGLVPYKLTRKNPNPTVHYLADFIAARGNPRVTHPLDKLPMWEKWEIYKSVPLEDKRYMGKSYMELTDNGDKASALKEFIGKEYNNANEAAKNLLNRKGETPGGKREFTAYINNTYIIKQKELQAVNRSYDDVLKTYPKLFQGYTSAEKYLQDADDLGTYVDRKQHIMKQAQSLLD